MTKHARRHSFSVPSLPPLGSRKAVNMETLTRGAPQEDRSTARHSVSISNDEPPRRASTAAAPPRATARPPLPPVSRHKKIEPNFFLRGINLDRCSDLLSIPDPPSPIVTNRRRQSSPLLMVPALKDLTNQEDEDNDEEDDSGRRSLRSDEARSRKNLSHVPSPLVDAGGIRVPEGLRSDGELGAKQNYEREEDELDKAKQESEKPEEEPDIPMKVSERSETLMVQPTDNRGPEDSLAFSLLDDDDEEWDRAIQKNSKRRRRRESMFLPSSIGGDEDATNDTLGSKSKGASPCLQIEDNQEEGRTGKASPSKRRKRQSIVLPSDGGEVKAYFEKFKAFQAASPDSSPSESTSPLACEKKVLADSGAEPEFCSSEGIAHVRDLVREYCSLPLSNRSSSLQAEEIERLTGYPLVPPAAKRCRNAAHGKQMDGADLNWSGSPDDELADADRAVQFDPAEHRNKLWSKLNGLVERMDKRKALDAEQLSAVTRCRVQRSRSGKFKYFDIHTSTTVRAQKFKVLYLSMLNEMKPSIRHHIQRFLQVQDSSSSAMRPQGSTSSRDSRESVELSQSTKHERSIHASDSAEALSNTLNNNNTSASSEMEEETESPSRLASPVAASSNKPQNLPTPIDNSESMKVCNDKDAEQMLSLSGSGVVSSPVLHGSVDGNESPRQVDSTSARLLLPLPSRDEASEDPEIAAAEQKLWAAIDAALETYSSEVLAIHAARRGIVASPLRCSSFDKRLRS